MCIASAHFLPPCAHPLVALTLCHLANRLPSPGPFPALPVAYARPSPRLPAAYLTRSSTPSTHSLTPLSHPCTGQLCSEPATCFIHHHQCTHLWLLLCRPWSSSGRPDAHAANQRSAAMRQVTCPAACSPKNPRGASSVKLSAPSCKLHQMRASLGSAQQPISKHAYAWQPLPCVCRLLQWNCCGCEPGLSTKCQHVLTSGERLHNCLAIKAQAASHSTRWEVCIPPSADTAHRYSSELLRGLGLQLGRVVGMHDCPHDSQCYDAGVTHHGPCAGSGLRAAGAAHRSGLHCSPARRFQQPAGRRNLECFLRRPRRAQRLLPGAMASIAPQSVHHVPLHSPTCDPCCPDGAAAQRRTRVCGVRCQPRRAQLPIWSVLPVSRSMGQSCHTWRAVSATSPPALRLTARHVAGPRPC